MDVSKEDFFSVASQTKLTQEQKDNLWKLLEERSKSDTSLYSSSLSFSKLAYYLGAFIVLCAMSWFFSLGMDKFGGLGVTIISTIYALLFIVVGSYLWHKKDLKIPGGLLFTLAVCMVPVAIYGLEVANQPPHQTPDMSHFNNVLMEIGTIIAAFIAVYFIRFPMIIVPALIAGWLFITDVFPFQNYIDNSHAMSLALLFYGLALIVGSYFSSKSTKADYAFWGYLIGLAAFSFGIFDLLFDNHFERIIYCLINVGLLIIGVILSRRVFIFFGAIGVFVYFSYLAYDVFKDSLLFPFIMSLFGLLIIYLGILYQKHEQAIHQRLIKFVPESWR